MDKIFVVYIFFIITTVTRSNCNYPNSDINGMDLDNWELCNSPLEVEEKLSQHFIVTSDHINQHLNQLKFIKYRQAWLELILTVVLRRFLKQVTLSIAQNVGQNSYEWRVKPSIIALMKVDVLPR